MSEAARPEDRIATLDIVRGVAVMGIFAMNVVSFAMPSQAHFNPTAYGLEGPADLATWFVTFIVFDGKMRGLFTFLFGASLLLVVQRAEAKGEDPLPVHARRMAWLLMLGAAHFVLLWDGDILVDYALVGLIAFFFVDTAPRKLLALAGLFVLAEILFMAAATYGYFETAAAARAPGASAAAMEAWRSMSASFSVPSPSKLADDLALHRGTYAGLVAHRAGALLKDAVDAFWIGGFETLGTMLGGMWALKSGFLTGAWTRKAYARIAVVGVGLGVAAYTAMAAHLYAREFDPLFVFGYAIGVATLVRPVMVLGLAAAVILATRRGGALVDRIAAVGRTAFTNYLATSIVATTIVYGYGFGLYGRLSRAELTPLVFAVWIAMLLWSQAWLSRYRYGPFEWLWRSLARGERQPMLR